jgi:WhiB family transcriptional regulator, redox-sensing transcriptional regulator
MIRPQGWGSVEVALAHGFIVASYDDNQGSHVRPTPPTTGFEPFTFDLNPDNPLARIGKDGRCRSRLVDPDWFFDLSDTKAKAICLTCPVRDLCLAYAVETDAHGVWGATDRTQRNAIRARLKRESTP